MWYIDAMLTAYIKKQLKKAQIERMEDGYYFASIPNIKGVWGSGKTATIAKKELGEVFEEWLFLQIRDHVRVRGLSISKVNTRAYA